MFAFIVAASICSIPILFALFYALKSSSHGRSKRRLFHGSRFQQHDHRSYDDVDGTATRASMSSLSDGIPRFFIVIGTVSGLSISIFHAMGRVFNVAHLEFNNDIAIAKCLLVIAWVVTLIQVILMIREKYIVARFEIGISIFISSSSLVCCLAFDAYWLAVHNRLDSKDISFIIGQMISGIKILWSCLNLPRRPEVFLEGHVVDSQYTTSLCNRYTFSWVYPLLSMVQRGVSIELKDLPFLDNASRANTLQNTFINTTHKFQNRDKPLWHTIYQVHRRLFIREWAVAFFESFAMMCPQICFYKILRLLEDENYLRGESFQLWFWVGSLGASKIVHLCLETWLEWIKFGLLATPVRSQLTALIFDKSMRMKDIKSVSEREEEKEVSRGSVENSKFDDEVDYSSGDSDGEDIPLVEIPKQVQSEVSAGKKGHGIVNLVGVDVQRLSMFCGENVLLLASFLKIILGIWFLVYLIGWRSTLAGLAMPILLQPVSRIVSKNYNNAQLSVMSARDEKAQVITEALYGIRQIKFSAMERKWQGLIMESREKELKAQWRAYLWVILLMITWLCMPVLLGAVGLSVYAWLSKMMTASVAFTSLSVFSTLEFTLSAVPINIAKLMDARISSERIQQHLEMPEKSKRMSLGESIELVDATLRWPSNNACPGEFSLRQINLQFPREQLSVIYGKTGSGKSLIIAGIIGEADLLAGKIKSSNSPMANDARVCPATEENWIIPGSLAYVAQIPWIENATIKSNILYLLPFDPVRYASVLYASALEPDLAVLPDGDETEVGATGINLSGGQRQRLTFARALYSRASILVLDDIFSAVDAHVGQHMVKYGLERELSTGRTIIVVTHHINLVLPLASYVVKVETDGSVQGFAQQPASIGMGIQEEPKDLISSGLSDVQSVEDLALEEIKASPTTQTPRGFVEETRDQGRVKWRVYQSYVRASGGWFYWTFTILIFGASAFLLFGRAYWIKTWTEASESEKATQTRTPNADRNTVSYGSDTTHQVVYYLSVYLAISFFSVVFIAIKIILVLLAALWSSKTLFENLTTRILRARLRWLDTVPTGRILNRFIGDFALIDSQLGMDLVLFLNRLFAVGTIVVAALLLSAWMVFPIAILGLVCIYYTSFYLAGARDIRRLESITKSPIFDLFDSALSGLSTIRSFGRVDDYRDRMRSRIDEYARASWYIILANRWVAFRQGLLGAVFALCVAASIVILPNINVALAAFALSFGIDFSRVVIIAIAQYAGFELDMNSTERVVEYITQTPVEEELGPEMPTHWPSQGQVEFANFETGYANHLPSVLKGINLHIKSRERVGICGRTGSGKSSLTLALFRFLEARKGSISIDGLDISQVKLRDLRHKLAIIPQGPVLFSGTLRTNLDPFNEYNDGVLWNALQRVHLVEQGKNYPGPSPSPSNGSTGNRNIFEDLEFNISRGGLNLSSGQRQLLCLARAILTRSKILVLDEATSAVDVATDNLIQRGIRENFENSTLIVIAHRLSTLSDFDKIVVLDDGRVVEFDTPQALIDQKGLYWQMLSESALNS